MKKKLLITMFLLLMLTGPSFAAEKQSMQEELEIEQKSCQNVFSLINIDLSVMSPRASLSDVNIPETPKTVDKKGAIVPITNKQPAKPEVKQAKEEIKEKNKTSLFRIDLLHIFKIQIL